MDLCARLRLAGLDVRLVPAVRAIHDARRESHRNPVFLARHLRSAVRFFLSEPCALLAREQRDRHAF